MPERLRPILDPNSYINSSEEALATNLSDVFSEASVGPISVRIVPFTLRVEGSKKVINPELGDQDILTLYSQETELDKTEFNAGSETRDILLNLPDRYISVWFSPPNADLKYNEGRVIVGYNKTDGVTGFKEMQSYGIPTEEITADELLYISWRLAELSEKNYKLDHPEDLREKPIVFELPKDEKNPWEFLRNYIPLEEAWDSILSGKADALKAFRKKDAGEIAFQTLTDLKNAGSSYERVFIIENAKRYMEAKGHSIDVTKICLKNLLQDYYVYTEVTLGTDGDVADVRIGVGKAQHVKNCPYCGANINRVIAPGYRCKGTSAKTCGKVYEGKC